MRRQFDTLRSDVAEILSSFLEIYFSTANVIDPRLSTASNYSDSANNVGLTPGENISPAVKAFLVRILMNQYIISASYRSPSLTITDVVAKLALVIFTYVIIAAADNHYLRLY
jgi:hypothetical protein